MDRSGMSVCSDRWDLVLKEKKKKKKDEILQAMTALVNSWASPLYKWDQKLVITVPADVLAPK